MAVHVIRRTLPAPAARAFEVVHDYERRLAWDTLLSAAWVEPGWERAGLGVETVCRGRTSLGRIALKTRYVAFKPGDVAAVVMVNRPTFFERWAASIRHVDLGEGRSEVIYTLHFLARPTWLRWMLHPLMGVLFRWETRRRLDALDRYLRAPARPPV